MEQSHDTAVLLTLSTTGPRPEARMAFLHGLLPWAHSEAQPSGAPGTVPTFRIAVLSVPLPTTRCHFPLSHLTQMPERQSHCLSPAPNQGHEQAYGDHLSPISCGQQEGLWFTQDSRDVWKGGHGRHTENSCTFLASFNILFHKIVFLKFLSFY